jgi:hypothetical protein
MNPHLNHSSIAMCQELADEPESWEQEFAGSKLVNRLPQGSGKCQLFLGGTDYSNNPVRECGQPGFPAEVTAPSFRLPREQARTRLFLCNACFKRSGARRPTRWIETAPARFVTEKQIDDLKGELEGLQVKLSDPSIDPLSLVIDLADLKARAVGLGMTTTIH